LVATQNPVITLNITWNRLHLTEFLFSPKQAK